MSGPLVQSFRQAPGIPQRGVPVQAFESKKKDKGEKKDKVKK